MIKRLTLLIVAAAFVMAALAQTTQISYGFISYNDLLRSMPEYAEARQSMQQLRQQYEKEALYNENTFQEMFASFLQGQKDFPKNILLKRQRDLQEAMEKGIAFRAEADSLLTLAEEEMLQPLRQLLDSAITLVGMEHGYEFIVNTDTKAYPFLHPSVAEDANAFVREKLQALKPSEK